MQAILLPPEQNTLRNKVHIGNPTKSLTSWSIDKPWQTQRKIIANHGQLIEKIISLGEITKLPSTFHHFEPCLCSCNCLGQGIPCGLHDHLERFHRARDSMMDLMGSMITITLQGINISHLGKRKIFKMPFLGDMFVSWRVCVLVVGFNPSEKYGHQIGPFHQGWKQKIFETTTYCCLMCFSDVLSVASLSIVTTVIVIHIITYFDCEIWIDSE